MIEHLTVIQRSDLYEGWLLQKLLLLNSARGKYSLLTTSAKC